MSFENFYLMLLLLLPFLLFAFLVLTNKEGLERVFSQEVIERIRVEGSGLSFRVRNGILLGAIFMMIIAVGHPYIAKGERDIELGALEIVMALDISGSMRSQDFYPNRLDFAKAKSKKLLDNLVEDEVMLLTFSDSVYLISPMTSDKETLKTVIDGITKEYLDGGSNFTAFGEVLHNTLKGREQKIAIVVSDGARERDLSRFKKIILDAKIKLYAVLIGTEIGAPILDKDGKAVLKNDQVVMSRLNRELGKIAKESGGDYIIADYGDKSIEELAAKIERNLHYGSLKKRLHVKDRVELFYYPLLFALLLLLLALFSRPDGEVLKKLFHWKGAK